jgi:ATP-dependent RNA helicase RhlE
MTTFTELGLCAPLLKALATENYETPTPIQQQSITPLLEGRDLVGIAQTGTGKTAAFALPLLHRLEQDRRETPRRSCRALILSPTRELAGQIAENIRIYGRHMKLTSAVVYGGVSINNQMRALANGVDILVATPGRLLDLIGQKAFRIDCVEIFVLDEADQMLDMGFIHTIRKLVAMMSVKRQTILFSATMPQEIAELSKKFLRDPVHVAVTPVATTAERVEQKIIFVDTARKPELLLRLLNDDPSINKALVFSRTKHGADKVVKRLVASGISAAAIHGNKSQNARERALFDFKSGHCRLLVATDIAARGIDIDAVSHVINYDLPNIPESYVHRIGRTARAGADGIAISFCDREERAFLRDIEKTTRQKIPVMESPLGAVPEILPALPQDERRSQPNRNGKPSGQRHSAGRPQQKKPNGPKGSGPRREERSASEPRGERPASKSQRSAPAGGAGAAKGRPTAWFKR